MTPALEKLKQRAQGWAHSPVDGVWRHADHERALNELAALTFRSEGAGKFLEYLEAITLKAVNGPGVSSDALRHLEGQRYIVGLIKRRIEDGRNKHPAGPAREAGSA